MKFFSFLLVSGLSFYSGSSLASGSAGPFEHCNWTIGGANVVKKLGVPTYDAQALASFYREDFLKLLRVANALNGTADALTPLAAALNDAEKNKTSVSEAEMRNLLAGLVSEEDMPLLVALAPRARPMIGQWSFPTDWRQRVRDYVKKQMPKADQRAYISWVKQANPTMAPNLEVPETVINHVSTLISTQVIPFLSPATAPASSVVEIGPRNIILGEKVTASAPTEEIRGILGFVMADRIQTPWNGDKVKAKLNENLGSRMREQHQTFLARFAVGGEGLTGWQAIHPDEQAWMERFAERNRPKEKKKAEVKVASKPSTHLDLGEDGILELFADDVVLDQEEKSKFLRWYRSLPHLEQRAFNTSLATFSPDKIDRDLIDTVNVEGHLFYVQRPIGKSRRKTSGRVAWVIVDGSPKIAGWYSDSTDRSPLASQATIKTALVLLNPPTLSSNFLLAHLFDREKGDEIVAWWNDVPVKERAAYFDLLNRINPVDLHQEDIEELQRIGVLSKFEYVYNDETTDKGELAVEFYVLTPRAKASAQEPLTRMILFLGAEPPLIAGWYIEDGTPVTEQPTVIESGKFFYDTF